MNIYEVEIVHYNCKKEKIDILSEDKLKHIKEIIKHIIDTEL